MNPATKAPSNTVRGALNGSAGHISPTPTGIRVRPSRARVDSRRFAPQKAPLALAQHSAREFLTEARAFASVEVCGVPPHSAGAIRAKTIRVRESIGQRDHHTDN
jgi:hypothetical protein